MKLNQFAYVYSKPLGNHTLKIMKKYLEICLKNMEKSWNFVNPKKWEPWTPIPNESKLDLKQWAYSQRIESVLLGITLNFLQVYRQSVKVMGNYEVSLCENVQRSH